MKLGGKTGITTGLPGRLGQLRRRLAKKQAGVQQFLQPTDVVEPGEDPLGSLNPTIPTPVIRVKGKIGRKRLGRGLGANFKAGVTQF